ncbi:cytochrome P450 [Microbacteriaceae bacterium VKM Ac-2855]|nr:cytochrome P450 [Microbacteriaceae bacterium VKM Ac-2855]
MSILESATDSPLARPGGCPFPHEQLRARIGEEAYSSMLAAHAATQAEPTTHTAARESTDTASTEPVTSATQTQTPEFAADEPKPAPPADLTVYYDPLSYAVYDHPYDTYKRLRDAAPVYYNPDRELYVVSRYADVRAGLANHEQLLNGLGNDMDGTHDSYGEGILVAQDPPRHTNLRQAVRRTFAAREILAREDGTRAFAQKLLADMYATGSGDFASDFALPMSIGMGISLIGSPAEDNEVIVEHLWRAMARTVGRFGIPDDAAVANQETEELLAMRFAARRAEIEAGADTSTSDAYTQILLASQKGKVFPSEQDGLAHLVLSAASDAPAALLTNIVYVLDKFPKLWTFLRENPDRIKDFVEETLRYETPGQNLTRQTTEEIEISGVTIPADRRVMFLQGSANRDERVYANPDVFDIDREFTPKNRSMSFGEGIHACMGAPFARLAAKITVEELLKGPDLKIVGSPERWIKQMVRGFSKLPVEFREPGAPVPHQHFTLAKLHGQH